MITAATLLLFLGATGKSAQIPLYTWLPDAMEGPTPVSALIHAATMVTAGRLHGGALPRAVRARAGRRSRRSRSIGAATALFAATIGLAQNDIKRVLAYSTVSQLGYMFMACGVGAFGAGIFHLMTHAFFKALLFLGAGSVIHALSNEQDMRRMGGLAKRAAVDPPHHADRHARDRRHPAARRFLQQGRDPGQRLRDRALRRLGRRALVGAVLTAFYMFRLYILTFRGPSRLDPRGRAPPARVAAFHDRAARRARRCAISVPQWT